MTSHMNGHIENVNAFLLLLGYYDYIKLKRIMNGYLPDLTVSSGVTVILLLERIANSDNSKSSTLSKSVPYPWVM